ncbi:MAG: hypothetical protein WBA22_16675 [Candidatus Methanofastidiosia archaeon]
MVPYSLEKDNELNTGVKDKDLLKCGSSINGRNSGEKKAEFEILKNEIVKMWNSRVGLC